MTSRVDFLLMTSHVDFLLMTSGVDFLLNATLDLVDPLLADHGTRCEEVVDALLRPHLKQE